MIDSTPSPAGAAGAKALTPELSQQPTRRLGRTRDELSTPQADQLRAALDRDPDVRAEMVAKGRAMAADPAYPPLSVIRQVASQIVNSPDLSEDQS